MGREDDIEVAALCHNPWEQAGLWHRGRMAL